MTLSTFLVTSRWVFRCMFIGNLTNWCCYLTSSSSLFTAMRVININRLSIRRRIDFISSRSCIYPWISTSSNSIVLIKLYVHIWSFKISRKPSLKLLLNSTHPVFFFFCCLLNIWIDLCYLFSDWILENIVKIKLIRQLNSEIDPPFSVSSMDI